MTIEKNETREYIAAITAELAKMAQQGGLLFLAYLLGLAQAEATGAAGHTRRKPAVQPTLASEEVAERGAAPPTH